MFSLLCSQGDTAVLRSTVECGSQLPLELSDDTSDDSSTYWQHVHLTKAQYVLYLCHVLFIPDEPFFEGLDISRNLRIFGKITWDFNVSIIASIVQELYCLNGCFSVMRAKESETRNIYVLQAARVCLHTWNLVFPQIQIVIFSSSKSTLTKHTFISSFFA